MYSILLTIAFKPTRLLVGNILSSISAFPHRPDDILCSRVQYSKIQLCDSNWTEGYWNQDLLGSRGPGRGLGCYAILSPIATLLYQHAPFGRGSSWIQGAHINH
ncbi:unnamed protein product [Arctogadus glacialis]